LDCPAVLTHRRTAGKIGVVLVDDAAALCAGAPAVVVAGHPVSTSVLSAADPSVFEGCSVWRLVRVSSANAELVR
jgi:hypothetical protein